MNTKTTLKILTAVSLISIFGANLKAQTTPEFKFQIVFEDAVGNKDTIYAGYDSQGSSGLDTLFDENNIKSIDFDSVFEVRMSNCFSAVADEYGNLNNDFSIFHTKTQILSNTCSNQWLIYPKVISILIHSNNYPIKVKWDNVDAFTFLDSCLYSSIFNFANPALWYDVATLYSPTSSFFFNNYLRNNDSITFDSILVWSEPSISYDTEYTNKPPEFYIDLNNDTIRVIYFGIFKELLANTADIQDFDIEIYPNPANNYIFYKGFNSHTALVQIFDIQGRKVLQQELANEDKKIDIKDLKKGLKLIRFETNKGVITKLFYKY